MGSPSAGAPVVPLSDDFVLGGAEGGAARARNELGEATGLVPGTGAVEGGLRREAIGEAAPGDLMDEVDGAEEGGGMRGDCRRVGEVFNVEVEIRGAPLLPVLSP